MFAAARVMAAGKSGLESLPYFVNEFLAHGITQLAPWAADHNIEQISLLNEGTQERRAGPWQSVHDLGNTFGASDLGKHLQVNTAPTQRLVAEMNPHAAETVGLADSPAQLAAWCRYQIWEVCQDTFNAWESFKRENGISTNEQQLAVVIPYCPEGPTSGTVGMYLGAALRKYFADEGRSSELVVWGIELCPPIDKDENGEPSAVNLQNAFRGYVAREEVLRGVPLSRDNPDDDNFHQPFDICIAFDGGAARTIVEKISREDIWKGLDRAAAQTTACLLRGAAAGDVDESTHWLKQGKRWNAYLAHVISELSYDSVCRYMRYRLSLPWHRSKETWNRTGVSARRDALIRRLDEDILPMLQEEDDQAVRQRVEYLVQLAEQTRGLNSVVRRRTLGERLDSLITQEEEQFQGICQVTRAPDKVIPRKDPFCIDISLPMDKRREATEKWRDSGMPDPIGDILGMSGATSVRDKIQDSLVEVLRRYDYDSKRDQSQAKFYEVIAISIEDRSRSVDNEEFRPSSNFLKDFIVRERRDMPGAFNALPPYNLNFFLNSETSEPAKKWRMPKTLTWHLPGNSEAEVPVEYSFLVLARCREQDGFSDLSTYSFLKAHYENVTSDRQNWRNHARYHGDRPPVAMEEGLAPQTATVAEDGATLDQESGQVEPTTNSHEGTLSSITENS